MKKRVLFPVLSAFLLVACGPAMVPTEATPPPDVLPILARATLFGNPDKAGPQISPDGKFLSFIAPVNGVLNVFVGPVSDPAVAKPVTNDTKRGLRYYFWSYNSKHILYRQDVGGDENWRVYSVDIATKKVTDLTPFDGVAARIDTVSHKFPNEIVIALNNRKPELHDLYRVDIATGKMKLIQQNDGFVGFSVDDDYNVRLATKAMPDGGFKVLKNNKGKWEDLLDIPADDSVTTDILGFDRTGEAIYMTDSRKRNTSVLRKVFVESGEQKLLAQNEKADVASVWRHPTKRHAQVVGFNYDRMQYTVLDPNIKGDFTRLRTISAGDLNMVSRTRDDRQWIVSFVTDDGPVRYYRYDRKLKKAHFLFTNRKDLEGVKLAKMHPVVIKSRDGLNLVSYLTLPVGTTAKGQTARPDKPLPMVLFVHGGPWARDRWGYNPYHQWLANRGYAVLSVNYRGSTGFGKDFVNASNLEWAGKMHDDLIDAVDWAVAEKIAIPDKVAIAGGSYGGYATLVGLTFTPDKFACGVDIVGPSNLRTLLSTIPPYWKPMMDMFAQRVGDPRTKEGKALLEERSPLNKVDAITRPLLIGQGANDPRVKQSESDQIVQAMKEKSIPVTYVVFPDEGHGFARPENRLAFNAVFEAFLAEHLGGERVEPIANSLGGSSVKVPEGAAQIKGLNEALGVTGGTQ